MQARQATSFFFFLSDAHPEAQQFPWALLMLMHLGVLRFRCSEHLASQCFLCYGYNKVDSCLEMSMYEKLVVP